MKPLRHLVIPALLFVLAAGAGWLSQAGHSSAGEPQTAASNKSAKTERTPRSGKIPPEVQERLAFIRNAGTREDRLRATIEVARTLPVKDLAAWFDAGWFDGTEDIQQQLFEQITYVRWVEEDGAGFMEYCLRKKSDSGYEVAGMWAERDPAAALAFARGRTDSQEKERLFVFMSSTLGKAAPELILSNLEEILSGLGSNRVHFAGQMLQGVASARPELLEAALPGLPVDLQRAATMSLTSATLRRDLGAGVAKLQAMEDGMAHFLLAARRDMSVLEAIGKNPGALPPGWLSSVASDGGAHHVVLADPQHWLTADLAALGVEGGPAHRLRAAALLRIAQEDADRAIAFLASSGWDAEQRGEAVAAIAGAIHNPQQVEAWLATLADPGEIEIARVNLVSGQDQAAIRIAPAELLAGLGAASPAIKDSRAGIRFWTQTQVEDFSRSFAQLPAEQRQAVARKFAQDEGEELPREIGSLVIANMIGQPWPQKGEQDPVSGAALASGLITGWADDDPAAAGDWVNSLPPSEERLWAAANLVARWGEYDPAAAARWMAGLPEAERGKVARLMKGDHEAAAEEER